MKRQREHRRGGMCNVPWWCNFTTTTWPVMQWMVGVHDAPSTPHSTQHPTAGRHHIYQLHPHLLGCLKLAAKCLVAFSVHQQASLAAVDCSLAVRAGDILYKSMQQWQSGAAADQHDWSESHTSEPRNQEQKTSAP
jgi:hypothetical protein